MINIHNIYYMLAYAFQVLNEKGYSDLATEEFSNIQNLFASILSKGISSQIKKGLGKEYLSTTEPLASPRGKLELSQSVNSQVLVKKQIYCTYDVFSENTYMNRILKASAMLLLQSDEVKSETKKILKRNLLFFSDIEEVDFNHVNWRSLKYNRYNANYKMLMNICYLLSKGLLMTDKPGEKRLATFVDDQQRFKLFEKFVREYYKKHFRFLNPSALSIPWDLDTNESFIEFLPRMNSDITLHCSGAYLIIDTKYYEESMQYGRFGKVTVKSEHLYQIYTYVKNKDIKRTGEVSGMLLYAKTDGEKTPDFKYNMGGNSIKVRSLDLNTSFEEISRQLDDIVYQWMPSLKGKKIS